MQSSFIVCRIIGKDVNTSLLLLVTILVCITSSIVPTTRAQSFCTLCPDATILTEWQGTACEQLHMDAMELSDPDGSDLEEEDKTLQCYGLQYRGVTECNCPIPRGSMFGPPTFACFVCEDKTPLPFPNQRLGGGTTQSMATTATTRSTNNSNKNDNIFMDALTPGMTCAEMAGFAALDAGAASCTHYQATFGVFCGCKNPRASQDASCRLCGNQVPLPNPNLVISAPQLSSTNPDRPCGGIEFLAQYDPMELGTCDDYYRPTFGDDCCNAPTTMEPSSSPFAATTTEPPSNTLATTNLPDPLVTSSSSVSASTALINTVFIMATAMTLLSAPN